MSLEERRKLETKRVLRIGTGQGSLKRGDGIVAFSISSQTILILIIDFEQMSKCLLQEQAPQDFLLRWGLLAS